MSTSLPSQTVTPEALELLRTIIDAVVAQNAFPKERTLSARNEPWLIDDLVRYGWLARSAVDLLVPTITGLKAAQTAAALETLRQAAVLWGTLRELYVEDASKRRTPKEIAQRLGLDERLITRLLTQLLLSAAIFRTCTQDNGGLTTEVELSERIVQQDPFVVGVEPEPPDVPGLITLSARDFRGLKQVAWSPEGVCLVAGPNGSGKTTLLDALGFLRDAFNRSVAQAVTLQRGAAALRRVDAGGPPEVVLGVELGDVSWELRISIEGGVVGNLPGETVKVGGKVVVRRAAHAQEWYLERERRMSDADGRTCLRAGWDARPMPALTRIVEALRGFQVYGVYALEALRNGGMGAEGDERLDATGQNLFIVLRNWKAAPRRFSDQFAWVLRHARRAFPGIIDDIEFDPPVGQIVPSRFYRPSSRVALPMHRAPDGLLVGLLHLTAVASAQEGSVIAIEEMENQLHPHAIRALLAAMREIAEERRLTILLTTHSPVLMNEFREHPEQFYVMEPGREVLPVPLDQIHDPEWLAHFSLGDLYDRMEFGAPRAQDG